MKTVMQRPSPACIRGTQEVKIVALSKNHIEVDEISDQVSMGRTNALRKLTYIEAELAIKFLIRRRRLDNRL